MCGINRCERSVCQMNLARAVETCLRRGPRVRVRLRNLFNGVLCGMRRPTPLPGQTPIERLVKPFQEFAKLEASGGILLIICTLAALIWANSPWATSYFSLW